MPVARVVVPGLEGPDAPRAYVPGPRASPRAGVRPMKACVFVGPTLVARRSRRGADDIVVLPPVAQGDVYRVAQEPAERDRDHRRLLRGRALGLAQGDPLGDGRGHPRVRQRQHGRAARRRAAAVRHGRRRPDLRGVSRRRARGRRRGRGDPWAGRDRLSRAVRGDGQHPRDPGRRPRRRASSRPRERMRWSASPRSCSTTTGPSSGCSSRAAEHSMPAEELEALRAWLPQGRVDQKREDALAMLAAMRMLLAGDPEPMRVDYTLEWTEMWDDATATAAASRCSALRGAAGRRQPCSRSCASRPIVIAAVRDRALLRFLASARPTAAGRRSMRPARGRRSPPARPPRPVHARRPRSLARGQRDRRPSGSSGCSRTRRGSRRSAPWPSRPCAIALLDELRLRNDFARLAARARDKQALLEAQGLDHPSAEDARLARRRLRAWYFEQRLGRPLPDDIDAAARELGFEDRADFDRALRREWLYCSVARKAGDQHDRAELAGCPTGGMRRRRHRFGGHRRFRCAARAGPGSSCSRRRRSERRARPRRSGCRRLRAASARARRTSACT